MELSVLSSVGLERAYKVSYPSSEVVKVVEDTLLELKKEVRRPGFRPGKVPVEYVRRLMGKDLEFRVKEKLVNAGVHEVTHHKEVNFAYMPEIKITSSGDFEKDGFEYELRGEVEPEMPELESLDLKIKALKFELTDDLQDYYRKIALQSLAEQVESEEAIAEGDLVTLDYDGKLEDGQAFEGGSKQGDEVVVGSGTLLKEFDEHLLGKKVGDEFKIELIFPEDIGNYKIADKKAVFDVKVNSVKKLIIPSNEEELVEKGQFGTAENMVAVLKRIAEDEVSRILNLQKRRALFDALDAKIAVEVPQKMLEASKYEVSGELYGVTKEEQFAELSPSQVERVMQIAKRRVILAIFFRGFGKKNNISVSDEEVAQRIYMSLGRYPDSVKHQIFEKRVANRNYVEATRNSVFENKVVDFLLEKVAFDEQDSTREEVEAFISLKV